MDSGGGRAQADPTQLLPWVQRQGTGSKPPFASQSRTPMRKVPLTILFPRGSERLNDLPEVIGLADLAVEEFANLLKCFRGTCVST